MNRNTIFAILAVIVVIGSVVGYRFVRSSGDLPYEVTEVKRGEIVQEVSASGKVESPAKIDLHFKNSGKLTVLRAKVGNKVVAGQLLAKQDTGELDAQLAEMQAGIDVQRAKLAQLLTGASVEDIQVSETAVANAEQTLIYKLQDAYTKADDAVRGKADQLFSNPQLSNPQLVLWTADLNLESDIEWNRLLIEDNVFHVWKPQLGNVTTGNELLGYVVTTRKYLTDIKTFLDKLALALNNPTASYVVGGALQTMPSNWKSDISTARTNINNAVADLVSAENSLKTAQNQLVLKKAPARSPDVALYEAQIRQAEAQMQKIQAQRREMMITAPLSGIITETNGEVGEIITPGTTVASLMPNGNLQIKLNISEADVVNTGIGQEARITLDAFDEDTEWKGKIASIDPAETIIGGAVYYQTTVLFDKKDERVRSGMTANVWIKTIHKENALYVPMGAVKEKRGQEITDSRLYPYVQILEGNQVKEKEVQTGIKGEGGIVEIISGLNEGEKIIVSNKK